ncbi:DUF222 domain-containing protein [Microbacterium sp. 18062]|uniref:DUF222 domain-containing protein n=1 Tax=Microbacterium sp. 18062 TaxID=2681410 RepID=UPI001F47F635|nr:DUF222 domain-containing protein [Microbacterium sp. 18062]
MRRRRRSPRCARIRWAPAGRPGSGRARCGERSIRRPPPRGRRRVPPGGVRDRAAVARRPRPRLARPEARLPHTREHDLRLVGDEAPARHPHVAAAVADSSIGTLAASAIVTRLDRVALRADPRLIDEAETMLAAAAPGLGVDQLQKLILRAEAHLDPDGVEPRERAACRQDLSNGSCCAPRVTIASTTTDGGSASTGRAPMRVCGASRPDGSTRRVLRGSADGPASTWPPEVSVRPAPRGSE